MLVKSNYIPDIFFPKINPFTATLVTHIQNPLIKTDCALELSRKFKH